MVSVDARALTWPTRKEKKNERMNVVNMMIDILSLRSSGPGKSNECEVGQSRGTISLLQIL
jgi:hypothetical protein